MLVRDLLEDRIANANLCPGATTLAAWQATDWIRIPLGSRTVPLIPLWGLRRALVTHDVHHALLDCPTSIRGECELAAWELASGGCGWNAFFWVDRLFAAALGLIAFPGASIRAARRGWGARNLYGSDPDALLVADVDAVRARMACADRL